MPLSATTDPAAGLSSGASSSKKICFPGHPIQFERRKAFERTVKLLRTN